MKRKPPVVPVVPTPQSVQLSPLDTSTELKSPVQVEKVLRKVLALEEASERARWEVLLEALEDLPANSEREKRALEIFQAWRTSKRPEDSLADREGSE